MSNQVTDTENKIVFKNVPDRFKKMELTLTFTPDKIKVWEDHILRLLVRDFYIFYSKIDKFGKGEFIELVLWCRPMDEISITYRLGCYAQAMFEFYGKKHIVEADHTLPDNYPKCIYIEHEELTEV